MLHEEERNQLSNALVYYTETLGAGDPNVEDALSNVALQVREQIRRIDGSP